MPAKLGAVSTSLCWLRVRLVTQAYDVIPQLAQVSLNTATASQAVTITDEVLGGSSGMPNQGPFQTAKTPVLPLSTPRHGVPHRRHTGHRHRASSSRSTRGAASIPGRRSRTSYASGPDDPHFILDRTAGQINFGDGRHGRIPVANAANPTANIVARSYSTGGGSQGNVGAGTVTVLQTLATGIASVTNALPASGGADPESLADAKLRAPSALQSQGRAVTAVGLRDDRPGQRRAGCQGARAAADQPRLPGRRRSRCGDGRDRSAGSGWPAPMPSATTLQLVCEQLNQARLITTEAFAIGPTYRSVEVTGEIIAAGNADLQTVQSAVQTAIVTWLHPLTGGDDGNGWPFGGTIYASRLFSVVLGGARRRPDQRQPAAGRARRHRRSRSAATSRSTPAN